MVGAGTDGLAVHLLWTGGWDSTYRLLELLLAGRAIQPHYILDDDRLSLGHELRTMARIRQHLAARPGLPCLHPTRFVAKTEIAPQPEITAAFRRLRTAGHLGSQYHWLARYAAQLEGTPLELCIDNGPLGVHDLRPWTIERSDGEVTWWELEPAIEGDLRLFLSFRLPLIHVDKPAMRRRAQELGFDELLEQTWFCHQPTRRGRPCGRCVPCRVAVETGLGDRVPAIARARRTAGDMVRRWARRARVAG